MYLKVIFFFLKKKKKENSGSTWYDVFATLTLNYFNSFNNNVP